MITIPPNAMLYAVTMTLLGLEKNKQSQFAIEGLSAEKYLSLKINIIQKY